jgi:GT2 family glycosyltransferase
LLFFDDDAFVSEETMKALYARLKQDQTISEVLYGRVLTIEHKRNYLSRAITSSRLHYINFDSICSIGLVFNRQVIEQVGLFDEQFGVGSRFGAGEESDLILRVLEHAVPIYFMPEFIVYHPQAIPDIQKAFRYGEGLGAVYKKHSTVNFTIKFVLLLRWCAEWMIRIGLIFFAFIRGRKQVVQFHRQYLQGFYQGFKTYENS